MSSALPPASPTHPSSLSSDSSHLESQLTGLTVSTNIHIPGPPGDAGLNGSKFIECMDYSISSFEPDICSTKVPSKLILPLSTLVSSPTTLAPVPRPNSRGFSGFVRKLSLRAGASKRDLNRSNPPPMTNPDPTEPTLESIDRPSANPVSLIRKVSVKRRRPGGLTIETTKSALWGTGLVKKNMAPSTPRGSSNSPLTSLASSSISTSSNDSRLPSRSSSKLAMADEQLTRATVERDRSTTQIRLFTRSPPMRLTSSNSTTESTPSFEVLGCSSLPSRKICRNRSEKVQNHSSNHNSFSFFSSKSTLATNNLED